MIDYCAAAPAGSGFVSATTAFIDCHTALLDVGAYQGLAAPGSTLSIVLTGLLTIFIALIGYNLLLGQGPTLRSGMITTAKIGMVFTLATSWPAYRVLVADLVTQGPEEIVGDIGKPIGLSGGSDRLVQRLDLADSQLVQLAIIGPGDPIWAAQNVRVAAPPFAGFSAFALGVSRIIFLLAAIAGEGVVKATIGLLLALGPFFVAFLMFDATRGFFVGWVRVLSGAAIGSIGVSIILGLELAMMEPWLANLLSRRASGEALPSMPAELAVITLLFAILVLVTISAAARLAAGFRLPTVVVVDWLGSATGVVKMPGSSMASVQRSSKREDRSRATEIAEIASQNNFRDRVTLAGDRRRPVAAAEVGGKLAANRVEVPHSRATRAAPSHRRSMPRVSPSVRKRDIQR